jgi:hypothetical protein
VHLHRSPVSPVWRADIASLAAELICGWSEEGADMAKTTRTLLAIGLVEMILAGIWFYLAQMGASQPDRVTPDFQSTLGSTMGMSMGAFLGLGVLLYFMAGKQDRRG